MLNVSDNFKNWLESEVVPTYNEQDFVSFEGLNRKLINSDYWQNMPKGTKGLGTLQFLKKN